MADRTAIFVGVGRGRPNAPPNGVGCAPTIPANGAVLLVVVLGVGSEVEWVGLVGGRADFKYESVTSETSEVSSYERCSAATCDLSLRLELTLPAISTLALSIASCCIPLTPLE